MENTNKIGNPVFITSVLILIINDFYLKAAFHNDVTGKLSDFAGLFAFPFLFSSLFYKHKNKIHLLTALLFVIWKSQFSQVFINFVNGFGLSINRVVDATDNIALVAIPISYFALLLSDGNKYDFKPVFKKALIIISCLSFMATSRRPIQKKMRVSIEKEYVFEFSKRELVSRLNAIQIKEISSLNMMPRNINFDSQTNVFQYQDSKDTLAVLLDYKQINDQDTIQFKTSFAEILITGNETASKLKLLAVYKFAPKFNSEKYQDNAIKEFEQEIIKKIKKY
jgi:hypothetical protein